MTFLIIPCVVLVPGYKSGISEDKLGQPGAAVPWLWLGLDKQETKARARRSIIRGPSYYITKSAKWWGTERECGAAPTLSWPSDSTRLAI